MKTDIYVRNEGTIVLFTPYSEPAQDWCNENLPEDCATFGDAYVVEHRYARDIMQGIANEGLVMEVS